MCRFSELTTAGMALLSYMQQRQNNYVVVISRPQSSPGRGSRRTPAADPRRPSMSDGAGEDFSVRRVHDDR